jgi:hypothetical protein
MSFIYSQALVAAFSLANCSEIDACAPSSGSHTPNLCLWHDKTMEPSHLSRFGLTCKPLTENRGAELLTWFREVFHARTSALPGGVQALTENAAACGTTWPGSFVKFDPSKSVWRTAQHSLLGDLEEFLETWPRWGSMRNGECLEHQTLVAHTDAKESGLLPTPLKDDWKGGTTAPHSTTGKPRTDQFRHWCKVVHGLTYPIPEHSEAVMGWPIGHTALEPLETVKFQEWQQQHGICSEAAE